MYLEEAICSECGVVEPASAIITTDDGATLCDSCIEFLEYKMCSECENYSQDYSEDPYGNCLCDNCMSNLDYTICADCGRITVDSYTIDEGAWDEKVVCDRCVTSYYICDDCESWISEFEVWASDSHRCICSGCSDEYVTCYDCESIIMRCDGYRRNDRWYCHSCDPGESVFIDYYHKPNPIFLGNTCDGIHPYLGVELEIDNGEDKSDCASSLNSITNEIYLKEDGSLNYGIEIITHPATLQYHTEVMPWTAFTGVARNYSFRSHDTDTCGLHVHVNRDFFHSNNRDIQDLHIAKILLLISSQWDNIVKFSRRNISQLDNWAKKPDLCIEHDDSEEEIVKKSKYTRDDGRYQALNLENNNTIEFRFFRGTLIHETLLASLQFVDSLCKFVKTRSLPEIQKTSWEDIVGYMVACGHTELVEYLERRSILPASFKQEELDLCV